MPTGSNCTQDCPKGPQPCDYTVQVTESFKGNYTVRINILRQDWVDCLGTLQNLDCGLDCGLDHALGFFSLK